MKKFGFCLNSQSSKSIYMSSCHSMVSMKINQRFFIGIFVYRYRPPELLLGERDYGPAIDMWGKAFFQIKSEF